MKNRSLASLLVAAAALVLPSFASAITVIEIVDLDAPDPTIPQPKTGLFAKKNQGPLIPETAMTLSQRHAKDQSRSRKHESTEVYEGETYRFKLYRCRDVLNRSRGSNTQLIIDIADQMAYFLVDGLVAIECPVSTARQGKSTPRGDFSVTERVRNGKISNLYDVEMPYWMRLDHTEYGVHAGYLPGYPASAGCIRLPEIAAKDIYDRTTEGFQVRILTSWTLPRSYASGYQQQQPPRAVRPSRNSRQQPPRGIPAQPVTPTGQPIVGRVRI